MRTPNLGSAFYAPGQPPENAADVQRFLTTELSKIATCMQLLAVGHLDMSYAAPTKPRIGDIRLADGTTWNPSNGQGMYYYNGTKWLPMNLTLRSGTAVLVGGTKVVNDASVTANTKIYLSCSAVGGTTGFLTVSARTAGVSFTILSSSILDTSTVSYLMVEP